MGLLSRNTPPQNLETAISSMRADISNLSNSVRDIQQSITRHLLSTDPNQFQSRLDNLQRQVEQIFALIARTSPVHPSGEPKAIHEAISAHAARVSDAMRDLEKAHTEWLSVHLKGLQSTLIAAAAIQKQLETSVSHVDPAANSAAKSD